MRRIQLSLLMLMGARNVGNRNAWKHNNSSSFPGRLLLHRSRNPEPGFSGAATAGIGFRVRSPMKLAIAPE
jgi:hypothetical protein